MAISGGIAINMTNELIRKHVRYRRYRASNKVVAEMTGIVLYVFDTLLNRYVKVTELNLLM